MKKLSFFILISMLFFSCWKVVIAPYDTEFNATRKKVGLRIIDSTFAVKKITEDHIKDSPIIRKIKGVPPSLSDIKKPSYVYKITYLDQNNGKIIYEEDVFISGISKAGVDMTITEKLIFRYVFKDYEYKFKKPSSLGGDINEKYSKGWEYIHEYPRKSTHLTTNNPEFKFYIKETKKITKKQADSILKSWKLKRLNY